jgi:hypothetical protein
MGAVQEVTSLLNIKGSLRERIKMKKSTSRIRNGVVMKNIQADPRDRSITDPFNMSDEQFVEFCAGRGPLATAVDQFDAEQQIIGLLAQKKPTYSMDEFVSYLQSKEDGPEAQGTSEASDASAAGDGRP